MENGTSQWFERGDVTYSDENGWINIMDENGLNLAAFHKDKVSWIEYKSGDLSKSPQTLTNDKLS